MSNVTPTTETASPGKPAWTRCQACKQRLWNDRVDIEVHRAVCPADLLRALKRLTKRVDELEKRPVAHVVELEAGPRLDFEHEAPWPDAPQTGGPEEDDEPLEVPDVAPPASAPPAPVRSSYFDDEDDEEDLDPAAIRASIH